MNTVYYASGDNQYMITPELFRRALMCMEASHDALKNGYGREETIKQIEEFFVYFKEHKL